VPRLLLVGHGKMARLIETFAPAYGFEIAAVLDGRNNRDAAGITDERCAGVDVAVDFSRADAVPASMSALAARRLNVVQGTTGWQGHEAEMRRLVADAGLGAVVAANFSLGANLVEALSAKLARRMQGRSEYGAWVHELHHSKKRDAPSGTALALIAAMRAVGYDGNIDVASSRAGSIPGTHTVGFDGPAETITLTHVVRDRATFAHGALEAARWVIGRQGWFTMKDVLGL
jgi:4-hydroxy-tetrahydrodipicolinate reductase